MRLRRLELADPADAGLWDAYVRSRADSSAADLAAWRPLYRELFGLTDVSLVALDGERVVGLAGTYLVPSPFFGRLLVGCPYFGYGGLYADADDVLSTLVEATERHARELDADFIEWRRETPLGPPYEAHRSFREFRLSLDGDAERIFTQRLRSNARQNVRRSLRSGLDFRVTADPTEAWLLISRTIRDLGTPYHSRRYFELLASRFPDEIRFSEVRQDGAVVAAGVLLQHRDTLQTPYIGSLRASRPARANYFQYWKIVEHCLEHGVRFFDLGRSPVGSPHEQFKLKWGAEPVPVTYSVRPISGRRTYRSVAEPSRLERLATRVWSRVPLAATRRFGHLVFRHLP